MSWCRIYSLMGVNLAIGVVCSGNTKRWWSVFDLMHVLASKADQELFRLGFYDSVSDSWRICILWRNPFGLKMKFVHSMCASRTKRNASSTASIHFLSHLIFPFSFWIPSRPWNQLHYGDAFRNIQRPLCFFFDKDIFLRLWKHHLLIYTINKKSYWDDDV